MVYFGTVNDKTLKLFCDSVNVNKNYSISDIESSDYWSVEDMGGVLRCVPLFHTQLITSSNPNDIVLDKNKCIIVEDKNDTVISCTGESEPLIDTTAYKLFAYTLDQKRIYCIVTDKYNNLIKQNNITVVNVETTGTRTVKTNNSGLCWYNGTSDRTYYFKLDNSTSNEVAL